MAVDLVTIHHEGSTAPPCTAAECDRFSHGGYCCGIGTDTFRRWRSASENWATLNFNGDDWTPCFSSSRGNTNPNWPVSDHDIEVLHAAFMDAYERGEVTAAPLVRAHRDSPGSATACPGDNVIARWDAIVNACRAGAPIPEPEPEPEDENMIGVQANAINHDGRPIVFQVGGDGLLYYRVRDAVGGDWGDWRHLDDGLKGFATVTAWSNPTTPATVEVWATLKNGRTYQRYQTGADRASWSAWGERTL